MKNYDEIADRVLRRRDAYVAAKEKKRNILIKTIAMTSCVCMIAFGGFQLWQSGGQQPAPPIVTGNVGSNAEKNNSTIAENVIKINQDNGILKDNSLRKMDLELLKEDFIPMNKEEITAYYGLNIYPDVPSDLQIWDGKDGIYKRHGGTGAVYYDGQIINYSNRDFSRNVHIELQKGSLPVTDTAYNDLKYLEVSSIHGETVYLTLSEGGYYHAAFLYKGVGFRVSGDGLSQEEMISVIESLLKSQQ